MPRIRRQDLPRDLWRHLLERMKRRQISVDQLALLADWLKTGPEVPNGRWFKRFPQLILCGEGELITFLQAGQSVTGQELP